ncbi:MAG: succinate dehydrogenase/fumarate reductase iron-sulfur subunit, partial [Candidatus Marinimicrobia bacterium]|nr:succinate dehydrogenase/fumarate reductase iron-sulfur subunit [Candidatus Neomarinimicrobiota bacterium]
MSEKINLTLKVWRQENTNVNGDFVSYDVSDVN